MKHVVAAERSKLPQTGFMKIVNDVAGHSYRAVGFGFTSGLTMNVGYTPIFSEFRDFVDSSDAGDALDLYVQLFDTLRRFHQTGYIHGDLKWENVLARKDEVVLADIEGCLSNGGELSNHP